MTCSRASAPSHVLFSLYLDALSEATIRPPDPTSKTASLLKPSPASLEGVTLSLCPHSPFPHLCVYSCYETFPGHLCKLIIPPPNTSAPSSMFICFSQALAIISCFIYFTASSCSLSVWGQWCLFVLSLVYPQLLGQSLAQEGTQSGCAEWRNSVLLMSGFVCGCN